MGILARPCFYARRTLELVVRWAYKHDAALRLPYRENLSALIHEPSFKRAAGEAVFSKARMINTLGNRAVYGHRSVPESDALVALRELFHVAYWFARTYARVGRPAPGLAFDSAALPRPAAVEQKTAEQLRTLGDGLRERDEKLATLLADKDTLDEELKRLRAEVAKAKKGRRRATGHARLLRSRDSRLLHRLAAEGSRLATRSGSRPRARGRRNAQYPRQGFR